MPEIVRLSYTDQLLAGKYRAGDMDVLVELDSSLGAFPVYLPDILSTGGKMFMFKNLGANNVTINTVNGNPIDYAGVFSKVLAYKGFYSIASNQIDKWISLETNP
jgi:hypothetical protein